MKKQLTLGVAGAVTAATVAAVLLIAARGGSVEDPASARCNAPGVTFGEVTAYANRKEVDVHFTCTGAELAGSLAIPPGSGSHPAAVWVHGSGESGRLTYEGAPLVRALVKAGVAVFSYDKRGVGESEGQCCPGDSGHFNLLAADAAGAFQALLSRPEIDANRIGFIGASQAGWVVPLAVSRLDRPVAFTALVDAPVVSSGEEQLFSHLTGEEGGDPSGLSDSEIIDKVRAAGPSGFEPAPLLRDMTCPSLWLYGTEDRSQPTAEDLRVLAGFRTDKRRFRAIVFPGADHGLLDIPPSDPDALPTFVRWIQQTVHAHG